MATEFTGEDFVGTAANSLLETLDIEVTHATPDEVRATMPVTSKVHQPYGILHGGASVVLAETVASVGASVSVDLTKQRAVGLEINANHLRAKRDGTLEAVAKPLHKGRTTHLWQIEIRDEEAKLVCVSRCTLAIIEVES